MTSGDVDTATARSSSRLFWRYWTASTISGTGDAVTAVALPLVAVTVLAATPLQTSLVTAATYAAWVIIGLPAGVIVARLPLRGTQVAMDVLRAAVLVTVPVAAWTGRLTLVQLVVVALVVSLATVIFDVGNSTFLPSIVPKDQLTARNSLTSATHSAIQTGGPALGGLLVQLMGAAASVVYDVVSYLVSGALLQGLPRPAYAPRPPQGARMRTLIREGWAFVIGHPVIRPCVLDATAINAVCGGMMALTPVFLVRTLGSTPFAVGLLIATEGIGSLVGAALTPRIVARVGSARALVLGSVAFAAFALLLPLATSGWGQLVFAVGNAGLSAGVVVGSIVTRTHRQTVTPPELLSRVMATVRFVSWGVIPVGALLAGIAANLLGLRTALGLVCLVAAASPIIILSSRVRTMRDLVDPLDVP
jgi:MFS family permease